MEHFKITIMSTGPKRKKTQRTATRNELVENLLRIRVFTFTMNTLHVRKIIAPVLKTL